jgi:hypothetical protein
MKFILALVAAIAISPLAAAQPGSAALGDPKVIDGIRAGFEQLSDADSRKGPSASVSGTLLLRDATYRYGERITEDGDLVSFASLGCDIFQVVLNVLDGAVTLVITESDGLDSQSIVEGSFVYPDKLFPESGMFAYTLYTNADYKSIAIRNGDFAGDTRSARITAFSYCFSTDPFATDGFFDNDGVMH